MPTGQMTAVPLAAAAADRLIVDLDVGVALVELVEPLRVDRVGERCTGAVHEDGGAGGLEGHSGNGERDSESQAPPSHTSPPHGYAGHPPSLPAEALLLRAEDVKRRPATAFCDGLVSWSGKLR